MDISFIYKGIIVGMIASIPMGPVGIMCVQRTLSKNLKSGLVSALGGASVDLIYASLGFFSLSLIVGFVENYMVYIKVIGGLFIAMAGVNIFMTNPLTQIKKNRSGNPGSYKGDFLSLALVSLANPAFMLVFIGYFAVFSINRELMTSLDSTLFLLGVFGGCMSWWCILCLSVNIFRQKIRPRHLLWLNRIAGTAVICLGVAAVLLMFVDVQLNGII